MPQTPTDSEFERAFHRNGFAQIANCLGAKNSGNGLLWSIKIDAASRSGGMYCLADCGLLDLEAQRLALKVWCDIDPRISSLDLRTLVIVSKHAGDWFQGNSYEGPRRITWSLGRGEALTDMLARVVRDCWDQGQNVWGRYRSRGHLFDLMTAAEHPFWQWRPANGLAASALYIALADLLNRPLADCTPTLARLWPIVQNSSGVQHVTIEQLFEAYHRVARG